MTGIELIEYDADKHASYLFTNLSHSLRGWWPWRVADMAKVTSDIRVIIADATAKSTVAVLEDDRDAYMGVSICRPGEIVWCYVGYPYRRHGLGTSLCAHAGPAPNVRYWTEITVRIARDHGRELHWAGQ